MGFQIGHIQYNSGRTHFKKGSRPWNWGTKGVMVAWNSTNTVIKCRTCNSVVKTSPSRVNRKKYCSKQCQYTAMQQHTPWNIGLHYKQNIDHQAYSDIRKKMWANRSPQDRKKVGRNISKAKVGFKYSEESKLKMRMAKLGKKQSKESVIKRISAMKKFFSTKRPSSIEVRLYDELKRRGLLFEKQKYVGNRWFVDAYIPSLNLVVEADGSYWHSLENVKARDVLKNKYLKSQGFNLLRLSESEIMDGSFRRRLD